jgi:hypothetical protein
VSVDAGRSGLGLGGDWPARWVVDWKTGRDRVSCSVRELIQTPMVGSDPVHGFSWQRSQHHRPGLEFMVSTGRLHGAESLEETRLLVALDFAGDVPDVVSQPLRVWFDTSPKENPVSPHARSKPSSPPPFAAIGRPAAGPPASSSPAPTRSGICRAEAPPHPARKRPRPNDRRRRPVAGPGLGHHQLLITVPTSPPWFQLPRFGTL